MPWKLDKQFRFRWFQTPAGFATWTIKKMVTAVFGTAMGKLLPRPSKDNEDEKGMFLGKLRVQGQVDILFGESPKHSACY